MIIGCCYHQWQSVQLWLDWILNDGLHIFDLWFLWTFEERNWIVQEPQLIVLDVFPAENLSSEVDTDLKHDLIPYIKDTAFCEITKDRQRNKLM